MFSWEKNQKHYSVSTKKLHYVPKDEKNNLCLKINQDKKQAACEINSTV